MAGNDTQTVEALANVNNTLSISTGYIYRLKLAGTLDVYLKDEQGNPIPEAEFEYKGYDGVRHAGKLGTDGHAVIENVASGDTGVKFTSPEDITVKAIAIQMQKAIEKNDKQAAAGLLNDGPDRLQRVCQAYDRYFNKKSGKGMVQDLRNLVDNEPDWTWKFWEWKLEKRREGADVIYFLLFKSGLLEGVKIVSAGTFAENRILMANPKCAVVPGSKVRYECYSPNSTIGLPGATDGFNWHRIFGRGTGPENYVTDRDNQKDFYEPTWKHLGVHRVICLVGGRGKNDPLVFHEYVQHVRPMVSAMADMAKKAPSKAPDDPVHFLTHNRDKDLAARGLENDTFEKIRAKLGNGRKRDEFERKARAYQDKMDRREKFFKELDGRIKGLEVGSYHPIKAWHIGLQPYAESYLGVFLAQKVDDPHTWVVVDWTDPNDKSFTGQYSGTADRPIDAIKKALASWKSGFEGNRYPEGAVHYEVPGYICGQVLTDEYPTTGRNWADVLLIGLEVIQYAAMGAMAVAATVVPGTQWVAGALWTFIFASTAESTLKIWQRHHEGFGDTAADVVDGLMILTNIFVGVGGAARWAVGRSLMIRFGVEASSVIRVGLIGSFVGDTLSGIALEGTLLDQYLEIMDNEEMMPDEKIPQLLRIILMGAGTAAMWRLGAHGLGEELNAESRKRIGDLKTPSKKGEKLEEIDASSGTQLKITPKNGTVEAEVVNRQTPPPENPPPPPPPSHPPSGGGSGGRHTPRRMEHGLKLDMDTAQRGGIWEIEGWHFRDRNVKKFRLKGELLDSIKPRSSAPNYNLEGIPGSAIGRADYERAHLWGPGFGDEARDGIMLAPREVNQIWQNQGVEKYLRELHADAAGSGSKIIVEVTGLSHSITETGGHEMLKEIRYDFSRLHSNGTMEKIGSVEIEIPLPNSRERISVSVTPGMNDFGSAVSTIPRIQMP